MGICDGAPGTVRSSLDFGPAVKEEIAFKKWMDGRMDRQTDGEYHTTSDANQESQVVQDRSPEFYMSICATMSVKCIL